MAGVDFVLAKGYVDEKRMGVTGGSGGGLLTNWIVTRTDRFAAAITQRCVSDWAGMYFSCDFAMFNDSWFKGAPWRNRAHYESKSPVWDLDKVNTPLMVLHSEGGLAHADRAGRGDVPRPARAEEAHGDGALPGREPRAVAERAPSRRVQNQQHIRRWFDHWLQGQAGAGIRAVGAARKRNGRSGNPDRPFRRLGATSTSASRPRPCRASRRWTSRPTASA